MPVSRCVVLVLAFVVPAAMAADNPWYGTWKLNLDKSTLAGDTYTIAKNGDTYGMDFGAVKYEFKEDGRDYPTVPSRTVSLQRVGENEWLLVNKAKGREISRKVMTLSADGATLTSHQTGTRADGQPFIADSTDTRVGGGDGLAGTWKHAKEASNEPETLTVSDGGRGAMRMYASESKTAFVTHMDGKRVPITGPRSVRGLTIAVRSASPISYRWTIFMKNQPYIEGTDTLTPDRQAIQEESWLVVKPAEKVSLIYERQ